MRIAFDHEVFTSQRFGGISRYFVRLAESLRLLDESPMIFAGLHQNEYLRGIDSGLAWGRFTPIYGNRGQRLRYLANDFLTGSRISRWRPDVIHETYFKRNSLGATNIPRIVTVHDMIDELFPCESIPSGEASRAKRNAVDRAAHVICISHNTRNDLIRLFGIDPEKISVVHHGIDGLDETGPDPGGPERPYLLYVGARDGYKNFTRVLEAVSVSGLHRDFDLVAFGGKPFSQPEVEKIKSLGLNTGRVRQVSGNDRLLAALYRRARALVYPSLYEGFGLPPLEAMASDCPVASSNTSSMPEVIGSAAEYFDPYDVDAISRTLVCVATDESRRSALIDEGKIRVRQFSWGKTAHETREVYRGVLG